MNLISEKGNEWLPDDQYYRDVISKVILFKGTEKIARKIGFSAYRANAVRYTVALLAYRTAGRVQFSGIWDNQSLSENLETTLRIWMPMIHEEIVRSAQDPALHPNGLLNVTEWCKKKECWPHMRQMQLDFSPSLEEELSEGMPPPNVGEYRDARANKDIKLTDEERRRQSRAMSFDSEQWLEIIRWAHECSDINRTSIAVASTVLNYAAAGWQNIPSPKQTKHTDAILDCWENSGNRRSE